MNIQEARLLRTGDLFVFHDREEHRIFRVIHEYFYANKLAAVETVEFDGKTLKFNIDGNKLTRCDKFISPPKHQNGIRKINGTYYVAKARWFGSEAKKLAEIAAATRTKEGIQVRVIRMGTEDWALYESFA
jgi:hypothetical protein